MWPFFLWLCLSLLVQSGSVSIYTTLSPTLWSTMYTSGMEAIRQEENHSSSEWPNLPASCQLMSHTPDLFSKRFFSATCWPHLYSTFFPTMNFLFLSRFAICYVESLLNYQAPSLFCLAILLHFFFPLIFYYMQQGETSWLQSLPFSSHRLLTSMSMSSLFLIRVPVIGIMAYSKFKMISFCILNLFMPVKTLFPCEFTFVGIKG